MEHMPVSWHDSYRRTPNEIILTSSELCIPGLRVLGWHDFHTVSDALQPHYHEDCVELAFIVNGNLMFHMDGQDYSLFGGDAFLVQPDVVHSTNELPLSAGELLWLQLDIHSPDGFLFLDKTAAGQLIRLLQSAHNPCIRTDNRLVQRVAGSIIATMTRTLSGCTHRLAAELVYFLYLLLDFADLDTVRVSSDIRRACDYIERNLTEPLTLQQVAEESGLSLSQFKFKFKSQIGLPPRSYINQRKIAYIKPELLRGRTATDVSADFGFCNSAYFCVVFKKYTGLTPTQFIAGASPGGKDEES